MFIGRLRELNILEEHYYDLPIPIQATGRWAKQLPENTPFRSLLEIRLLIM